MKQKVFFFAVLLMALAIPQSLKAYDFSAVSPSGHTLYYNLVDGGAVVTKQLDGYPSYAVQPSGNLIIPDSVVRNGVTYPVTRIDDWTFAGCTGLISVVIGNEVTTIGGTAFSECHALTSVTIGNSVTIIGRQAFGYCSSLTSIVIPNSVTSIGEVAFSQCTNLTSVFIGSGVNNIAFGMWSSSFENCPNLTTITIDPGNTYYDSRNNCNAIIETATNTLMLGCAGTVIPSTVTAIGNAAFYEGACPSTMVFSDALTSIGEHAFHLCTGLTSVTFGNSLTSIGESAFADCYDLISVTFGNSATSIGQDAFTRCYNLASVNLGDSVTAIGSDCFRDDSSLTTIIIPNSVEIIGYGAFSRCSNLSSVTLGNSVAYIGGSAFADCRALTSITFPSSLNTIDSWAFVNCSTLTTLTIPNSVIVVGDRAFGGCTSLTSVYIGSGVSSFGIIHTSPNDIVDPNPFPGCSSLTSITVDPANPYYNSNGNAIIKTATNSLISGCANTVIPSTVTSIGYEAFYGCTGLTSIELPNSLTSIGESAFWGCIGLTSVIIPNSVISIDWYAFRNCSGLSSVTIGNGVTNIGDNAFIYCSNLDSVVFLSTTPPTLNGYDVSAVFNNYYYDPITYYTYFNTNIDFFVPCGLTAIYQNAWPLPTYQAYLYNYVFREVDADVTMTLEVDDPLRGTANIVLRDGHRVLCADSSVVIGATADAHYHFDHWSNGHTANPDTLYLDGDSTLTAFFAPNWYSVVGTSNNTTRGTVTGSDTVEYLDTVTLVAVANYGYHLNYWRYQNDNGGYQNQYDTDTLRLAATRNKTATAYFAYNQYSITLSVDSAIYGTVSGAGSFNYLSNRTITATANNGYHFVQWSDGNTDNPRTISLTQDTVLIAQFAPNVYTLTVTSNDETIGTVTGGGSYEYLDTVPVTATVIAAHHHFVQWSDGVTDAVRTEVITADMTLTAIFAVDTHLVSATVNNDNYGTVNGTGSYPYGATVSLEAVPEEGYYFVKWSNDVTDNPATFTCTGDTTLSAIFSDEVTPNLCMVNVQNNRNVVIWTKELEVVEYKIYREGTTTGNYDLMATVPYDSLSMWVDQGSNPMTRSYRYKMTAVDSWGNESPFSDVHKTMHLRISQGMGTQWNLEWNEYEGAEFITYMIYRGNAWGNLQLIDQMSVGDNTSYTDVNAPAGPVYYQVVVVKSSPCNITKSESLINSNIATNEEVGIAAVDYGDINVYAANGRIVVEGAEGEDVRVYDMVGRQVSGEQKAEKETHLSVPASGVYIIKVGNHPARRVVVVR